MINSQGLLPYISVVTPSYRCSEVIEELYARLIDTFKKLNIESYEIIIVNDNSPECDWQVIKKIASINNKVIGINLSRNFGQHYAITAGLAHASGDYVVVMDCDLQDKPEEIPNLINKIQEGFDSVLARRSNRQDGFFKKNFSKIFYWGLSYLTETKQDATIGNFGIYSKKVVQAILLMKDNIRYFPTMVKWVGFNISTIDVEHAEREKGKSSYSIRKLINLALDVMLSFSEKPLKLTVKLGLIVSGLALLFAVFNLVKYSMGYVLMPGWTSLIISIWFLSGLIIFVLGIVGLYIGKIFNNVKGRPFYIIDEIINY